MIKNSRQAHLVTNWIILYVIIRHICIILYFRVPAENRKFKNSNKLPKRITSITSSNYFDASFGAWYTCILVISTRKGKS